MTKQYIRVKKDGFIYEYSPTLAANSACEVISEEQAYPERFVPAHALERIEKVEDKPARRGRKAALDLTTADVPEAPAFHMPELDVEASKGLL